MSDPVLHIFSVEETPGKPEVRAEVSFRRIDQDRFDLADYILEIENDLRLEVSCSLNMSNLGYSFHIKLNEVHVFSVLGNMHSEESPDPTIMYTAPNGYVLQFGIST